MKTYKRFQLVKPESDAVIAKRIAVASEPWWNHQAECDDCKSILIAPSCPRGMPIWNRLRAAIDAKWDHDNNKIVHYD